MAVTRARHGNLIVGSPLAYTRHPLWRQMVGKAMNKQHLVSLAQDQPNLVASLFCAAVNLPQPPNDTDPRPSTLDAETRHPHSAGFSLRDRGISVSVSPTDVFFFGEPTAPFSNFSPIPFTYNSIVFSTSEHAYQHAKLRYFLENSIWQNWRSTHPARLLTSELRLVVSARMTILAVSLGKPLKVCAKWR